MASISACVPCSVTSRLVVTSVALKPDGTFSSSICVTVRVVSAMSRATIVTVAISTPSGSVQPSGTGMV